MNARIGFVLLVACCLMLFVYVAMSSGSGPS